MGKIYYFTTAQRQDDFRDSLKYWDASPNLSNQNFHNKLIKAISLTNRIDVISVRPINEHFALTSLEEKIIKEDNITWKYVEVNRSKIDKFLHLYSRVDEIAKKHRKEDIVITDTLNLSLLKIAYKFAKKRKLPIIGICTDNPLNISFTSDSYKEKLLKLGRKLDKYICLTEKLDLLYNPEKRPSIIIDGVTEDLPKKKPSYKISTDYIFFGGSLMKEYGVYNLIQAFKNMNMPMTHLVICGHHEQPDLRKYINTIPNAIYLGPVSYEEVNALQKGALLAVNPRPINSKIDEYSFPSKTLEYLSNGVLTVTVDNPILRKGYNDVIIWADSGEVEDLQKAMEKALALSDKKAREIKKAAIELTRTRTSLAAINSRIKTLL